MTIYSENGISIYLNEDPMCVFILTPLMKRSHSLPMASEMVFIDTTSSCDSSQSSVTFLLTPCAAGAAPLGVLITSGQSTQCYATGFSLLKENFPDAFNKKGFAKLFMTDNSSAEIEAIAQVWPESNHLLCIFHILQAVWRWLWDSTHGIPMNVKSALMNDFQEIVYARNIEDMNYLYKKCLDSGKEYEQWLNYITVYYWSCKEKWCLCYRDYNVRGHQTNNYAEAAIRVFKEIVLSRFKAYNVVSLTEFSCTALEDMYVTRFRDFANFRDRRSFIFFRKCLQKVNYLTKENIIQETEFLYYVPSERIQNIYYCVNVAVGSCTCEAGKFGKFCKHECAVYKYFDVCSKNFPAVTAQDRHLIMKIAVGEVECPDSTFYEDFLPRESSKSNVSMKMIAESANESLFEVKKCEFLTKCQVEETVCELVNENSVKKNLYESLIQQNVCASENKENESLVYEELPDESMDTVNLIQEIHELLSKKVEQFQNSIGRTELNKLLRKHKEKLENAKHTGQFQKFLLKIPEKRFKSGAKINAQPTSIARRKMGITRGSKRLPGGRHPKDVQHISKTKRLHKINYNIIHNIK